MATTPRGITLLDGASIVNPIQTPFNKMANEIDSAITNAIDAIEQGYFIGTAAQRAALVAPQLRNGITWFETDTNITWERRSGSWVARAPYAMAAGVATVGISFPKVNLPAGRFSVPPIITAQVISGAGADIGITAMVTNITTTNFQVRHTRSSGDRTIHWQAVQMTATSAAG